MNPKKSTVNGPLNDSSVIISLLMSFKEKDDPLNDETYSSSFFSIDRNIGNIINRKINKHPTIIVIEVFNFIVDNVFKLII